MIWELFTLVCGPCFLWFSMNHSVQAQTNWMEISRRFRKWRNLSKNPEIHPFRVLQENSGNHVSFYHALEAQENQTLFSKAMLLWYSNLWARNIIKLSCPSWQLESILSSHLNIILSWQQTWINAMTLNKLNRVCNVHDKWWSAYLKRVFWQVLYMDDNFNKVIFVFFYHHCPKGYFHIWPYRIRIAW